MQEQNFIITFKDGTETTFDKVCGAFAVVSHPEIDELVYVAAKEIIARMFHTSWYLERWCPIGGNKIRLELEVHWGCNDIDRENVEIDIRRIFDSAFNSSEIDREIQERKEKEERLKKEKEEADRLNKIQNAQKAIEQNIRLLREAGIEPNLT